MKTRALAHLLEPVDLALPLDRYRDAFPSGRGGFVLDGGDFTMLGAEPFLAFRAFRSDHRRASGALAARVVIDDRGVTTRAEVDDPLDILRVLLREHAVEPALFGERALPLLAGAVGYLGYETGQMLASLPCLPRPGLGMPDIALFFHDWVLGRCRSTDRAWLSVLGRGHTPAVANAEAERTRDRILSVLASFEQRTRFPSNPAPLRASSPPSVRFAVAPVSARSVPATTSGLLASSQARLVISRDDHLSKILTARAHIDSGAASEICLTQRIDAPFAGDPFALWQELRRASASPFAAFFDLPEGAVVSSSPERLLSVDQGHDGIAAIRASFPPESMTGTPKLEAMTLLERLEPTERGVYSGALGWMDFAGPLELSVVTRTIIVKDGHAHLHVGGAIVTDSNEATEHDVTMNDARELLAALAMLAPQDASTSGAAP